MKKEDLINGGYYHYDFSTGVIFKYNRGASVIEIRNGTTLYRNQSWGFDCAVLRPATKDETTWLKACEKADKFVSKEEALKPQFEVGKWYKGLGFDKEYIAKFHYLTAKKFTFTECISPITGYSKTNAYLEIYDNVIECPLSEIQQYLPDGHVDKFVKEIEPEIPEYVECILNGNNATMHQKYCGINVEKGTIYKVTEKSMPNKGAQSEAYVLKGGGVGYCLGFKPSTKEAFDNQNKPKVTPEPIKYPDLSFKDFGVHIHKGNYQELENIIWEANMTPGNHLNSFFNTKSKSNDLEFQYPVINVRNKKKSKLIIINQ